MMETGGTSPWAAGTANSMTTSVAEEVRNATSVGDNRAHSHGGSRENKCGDIMPSTEGGGCSKEPLCNGDR